MSASEGPAPPAPPPAAPPVAAALVPALPAAPGSLVCGPDASPEHPASDVRTKSEIQPREEAKHFMCGIVSRAANARVERRKLRPCAAQRRWRGRKRLRVPVRRNELVLRCVRRPCLPPICVGPSGGGAGAPPGILQASGDDALSPAARCRSAGSHRPAVPGRRGRRRDCRAAPPPRARDGRVVDGVCAGAEAGASACVFVAHAGVPCRGLLVEVAARSASPV
jgi:hypothetical protein